MSDLRRTPLTKAHRALGARLVDFAGWEMPVWYSGIREEHEAVRQAAGLFDVSHMGEVEIRGPRALEACQRLVTNDASRLAPGRAQYTVLCNESGGVVDDVVYYRLGEERFLFCVNAANREKDARWIRDHCAGVEVVDRSDELAQIALQGPKAESILSAVSEERGTWPGRFRIQSSRVAGVDVLVSRTGYTGEDGFEIYVAPEAAEAVWSQLLEAGSSEGLRPAGLGARDTLRLEAGLLLYGNDLDETTDPFEAGLGWVVRLDKGDFVGREALERRKADGPGRRLVGIEMEKGPPPRKGYRVRRNDAVVGTVTSGAHSPTLGRGIALALVAGEAAVPGNEISVEIRKRFHPGKVVRTPFLRR